MPSLFEAVDLLYEISGKRILDGLSLSVASGEIHAIMGVNGTGKTTLASLIMGLEGYRPTSGKLLFEGKDITGSSITERGRLGIALAWQMPASFEGITVSEYLRIPNRDVDVSSLLAEVGFNPKAYANRVVDESLSGGERKRIELAAVIATSPKLVVLDEPDSGIDMASIGVITGIMRRLRGDGASVLLITHNEKMAAIGDRVSLLCGGKIVKEGKAGEMAGFFERYCKGCEHVGSVEEVRLNG